MKLKGRTGNNLPVKNTQISQNGLSQGNPKAPVNSSSVNDNIVIDKQNVNFFKSVFNLNDEKSSQLKMITSTSLIVSTVFLIAFSQLLKNRFQMMVGVGSIFAISMLCLYFSESISNMIKLKENDINLFHASVQSFVESKITKSEFLTPFFMFAVIVGLILLLPIVSSIVNMGISAILMIGYSYLFYKYVMNSAVGNNNDDLKVMDYVAASLAFSVPISLVVSIFTSGYMASISSFAITMVMSCITLYLKKFNKNMDKWGFIMEKIYKLCGKNKTILSAALVGVLLVGVFIIHILKPLFLLMFGMAVMLAFFAYFANEQAKNKMIEIVDKVKNFPNP